MISKQIATKNIKLQTWINFLSGVLFLLPVFGALQQIIGLSILEMVIIANVGSIVVWVFELPTSVFADTVGRKSSLVISLVCNFISAIVILIYPSYIWFLVAAFFGWLYFSFWSGAGQAFLDENLRECGRENEFGKVIGDFIFAEKLGSLLTPLVAAWIIKYFEFFGYRILAFLDVIVALILVILVIKLVEKINTKNKSTFKELMQENIDTAKNALKNVFFNSKLRFLLIYRSLSNPVAFLYVVFAPIVINAWMSDWYLGIIMTIASIWVMLASKFAYKLSDKIGQNMTWIIASTIQWILYIITWFILQNWVLVVLVYILFDIFEHLWYPAWNQILIEQSQGLAVATTRSIIFSIFALYTTLWKQFLAIFPLEYAFIWAWIFIVIVNIVMSKKMMELKV